MWIVQLKLLLILSIDTLFISSSNELALRSLCKLFLNNRSLPLKRTGQPEDMGEAIYNLLTAKFCTGVILDVDGGHGIRQYANPTSDPMRQSPPQK